MPIPPVRDVVLLGGGHAHVQVLKRFGMRPQPGVRLTLITRELKSPYSGMLPGCIAGTYEEEDIFIELVPLCQFAGARLIHAEVDALDLAGQYVLVSGRPKLRYDYLSINTGAVPVGSHPGATTVKPIGEFLPKWRAIVERFTTKQSIAIVGAGAGGLELAFAAVRVLESLSPTIKLVGPALLPGHCEAARQIASRRLAEAGIHWIAGRAREEREQGIELEDGRHVAADYVLWVTDVHAPPWLATSGLSVDSSGFMNVDHHLNSTSHPNVFGAGDVVHLVGQVRPKSGVYAVRAGPVLAANLSRVVRGRPLKRYRAQLEHLALIGTSDGRALASRGRWARYGTYWWRLKDVIDRRFMAKFNELPVMDAASAKLPEHLRDELPDDLMRCGGCGAKLAADPLRRVLAQLPEQNGADVLLGIGDDAAQICNSGASTLLTVDGFRAMISDPYRFGRIVAHHSLNDIYAMAATPRAALAFVTLPLMSDTMMEEDLLQILSGITDVLNAHGANLVGGHSAEGAEFSVGLTVVGHAGTDGQVLTKEGAQPGDAIVLCKALGTGVLLAAAMRGRAGAKAFGAAIESMDQSNAPAAQIMVAHDARALTDITGFGLVGHLGEVLRASQCGARIDLDAVLFLPDAVEAIEFTHSSLHDANTQALTDFVIEGVAHDDPRVRLFADPQTSGGLLACLPQGTSATVVEALREAGYTASCIGQVTAASEWRIVG